MRNQLILLVTVLSSIASTAVIARDLVERVEFNPATGSGRVLYRIAAAGDGRFRAATGERVASPRGFEPRLWP